MFRSKFSYSNSKSSYSDLLKDIETGKIESIFFYPRQREIDVLYKNGDKFKIPILYNDQLILEKATENKVDLTINFDFFFFGTAILFLYFHILI